MCFFSLGVWRLSGSSSTMVAKGIRYNFPDSRLGNRLEPFYYCHEGWKWFGVFEAKEEGKEDDRMAQHEN